VRLWVRRADIDDGPAPGVTTSESARLHELEQEVRELRRANEILKRAASFFGPFGFLGLRRAKWSLR